EITLQQFHHLGAARRIYSPARYYLGKQTRRGVRRQLISVFAARPARDLLATISVFAKRFLIDVDISEAKRRKISIDRITFVLPLRHLFRRQLVAPRRVCKYVNNVLRSFV